VVNPVRLLGKCAETEVNSGVEHDGNPVLSPTSILAAHHRHHTGTLTRQRLKRNYRMPDSSPWRAWLTNFLN